MYTWNLPKAAVVHLADRGQVLTGLRADPVGTTCLTLLVECMCSVV